MPLAAPLQRLSRRQDLPLRLEDAWDFFSRPENLARITPRDLGFEVTSGLPERMYAGMIVSYRVRPLAGVGLAWITEITHVNEPRFFVDEQRSGPYRFWHHQHHFEPLTSGVRMTDLVHYQLPCGWPGHLLFGGIVADRLQRIFAYRSEVLSRLFD
ncbi:MAG TPA: SRPBCC family protein [Desulfuromonadales bacterium]|nr:SRPBCC family protein [Desulfuromonadales bacterium]